MGKRIIALAAVLGIFGVASLFWLEKQPGVGIGKPEKWCDEHKQEKRIWLHCAAVNGDVAEINRLIADGADVNQEEDIDLFSFLGSATNKWTGGNPFVVIDLTTTTPLHWAADRGHAGAISALAAAGADVNIGGESGRTPLHRAADKDRVDAIAALTAAGADVNLGRDGGYTPLHQAAHAGNLNAVNALIKAGANVNLAGQRGITPLHWAASQGHAGVIKAFAKVWANVNVRDNGGGTPMHWAANNGQVNAIITLAAVGAEVNTAAESRMCRPFCLDIVHCIRRR